MEPLCQKSRSDCVVNMQAVAAAKEGIEALLGPPAEVRVAAAQPDDSLHRWGNVFSTIQVQHSSSHGFDL